ncbi:MAG: ATP-binding protein, partial [Candidatus Odinarchaeia archaeon]
MKSSAVNITDAIELTIDIIKAGLVPMITSSPGMGKSDLLKSIAKSFKMKVIDLRLSQADSVDLNGFPTIDLDAGVSRYIPFDTFPTENTPIPEGYSGWMLLLDEINSAPNLVQAAAYKLILDREVGQHKLHPKLITVAAGNLATDKAIVNRLSTAMQSRLIHLEIKADLSAWVNWAMQNDIDYRIIAFLQFKPDLLHKFNPSHNDITFPCPRTWHFLSKLIKNWKTIPNTKLPLLTGTVSEGVGIEFKIFCDIFTTLPKIEDIIANPK